MGIFGVKKEIGADTLLHRKKDLLFNQIDGEVVMLSIENSEYYGMDRVGSRIWELLEQPVQFSKLIATLLEEYEVTEEKCREDTLAFLGRLAEKNIIVAE
jgi:hypothetical protein